MVSLSSELIAGAVAKPLLVSAIHDEDSHPGVTPRDPLSEFQTSVLIRNIRWRHGLSMPERMGAIGGEQKGASSWRRRNQDTRILPVSGSTTSAGERSAGLSGPGEWHAIDCLSR